MTSLTALDKLSTILGQRLVLLISLIDFFLSDARVIDLSLLLLPVVSHFACQVKCTLSRLPQELRGSHLGLPADVQVLTVALGATDDLPGAQLTQGAASLLMLVHHSLKRIVFEKSVALQEL